jgi:transcriptional regulator with XRE-family HTH domain
VTDLLRETPCATILGAKEVTVKTSAQTRRVLRRVLEQQPCSLRRLAEAAGVDHATLLKAAAGERNLTAEAAAKLVKALRTWGTLCNRLAQQLEDATRTGGQT